MDETKSMIRDIEDLLIHTPGDTDLVQMRDSLIASLEHQQHNITPTLTHYAPGSLCCIPFTTPWSSHTVLLPARVLKPTVDLAGTTDVLVLILTPLTQDVVPCLSLTTTTGDCDNHCNYSHGYRISADWLLPIETMDLNNTDAHYQPHSLVWYKSTNNDDDGSSSTDERTRHIWKNGTLESTSTDPTTGDFLCRVFDSRGESKVVGENQVIPMVYLDDNDTSRPRNSISTQSNNDDNDTYYEEMATVDMDRTWGAWQSHTTGFGEKMMKKMGYIKGDGLGVGGKGRLDPVQAYQRGTQYSLDNRPGLGSLTKKKKPRTIQNTTPKPDASSMFDMMNSMFVTKDEIPPTRQTDRSRLETTSKQTNQQTLWQLQEKMSRLVKERQHGLDAVKRNKGTTMEREFKNNVQKTARQIKSVQQELDKAEGRLTRAKNLENMISF